MTDGQSNPRHKIEAIKELRTTATVGSGDRPRETERFVIRIDFSAGGGDVTEKGHNHRDPDGVIEGNPDGDRMVTTGQSFFGGISIEPEKKRQVENDSTRSFVEASRSAD